MLFSHASHAPIARGEITRTIRRWRRPQARVGGRYRLASAGSIEVDAVAPITEADLTREDAHRSGFASLPALLAALPARPDTSLYRVDFHYIGQIADPRVALAADANLEATELAAIAVRLAKMDNRGARPWTAAVLGQIEARPGTVSHQLAAAIGVETPPFKANVRKLKALGLTISLETGYELSPRGRALLAHLRATQPDPD
ncbi:MAG: hypothetical protein O3A10_07015 [Chloroflexi bacterium]|nr:hypothetical protein [Chloroflexota bacterium]MDA1146054.1 hypothetical protein [Chloroflexota bacterium]